MKTFRDHKNRDWELRLTTEVMFRWRDKAPALGLPDPMDLGEVFNALWGDPLKAARILQIVLAHPLADAKIDPGLFLLDLDSATLWRAQESLIEEYRCFFAQPAQRALAEALYQRIQSKSEEIQAALKSGPASIGPLESPASTPDPGPTAN